MTVELLNVCHGQSETIDQFVTELKNQAKKCEFADLYECLIKDRIVGGITSDTARARLLREPELSLRKAVDICRVAETTSAQLKDLNETTSHDDHKVHVVKQKKSSQSTGNPKSKNGSNQRKGGQKPSPNNSHRGKSCGKCGTDHPPRQCPAFGRTCYKCGVKNHYKSMCRSTGTTTNTGQTVNHLFIGVVNRRRSKNRNWETTLNVNNHMIDLKLDTGAEANVIPEKMFRQVKGKTKLQKSNAKLSTYTGQGIPVLGKCVKTQKQNS
ncbi:uncharacterized protein [Argopecten irradians]|uniref:uncharacterized protein n=1 Tax=Argopecten irradians TaxID=31199 RepID=UPI0037120DC9